MLYSNNATSRILLISSMRISIDDIIPIILCCLGMMGRVKAEARREYVFREGNVQQIQRAYRQHLSRSTLKVSILYSDRICTVYVKIYYIMSYYTFLRYTIYYVVLYCTIQILSFCVVQFNTTQYNTLQTLTPSIPFKLSRHVIPIVGKSRQLFIEKGHYDLQFHLSKS